MLTVWGGDQARVARYFSVDRSSFGQFINQQISQSIMSAVTYEMKEKAIRQPFIISDGALPKIY